VVRLQMFELLAYFRGKQTGKLFGTATEYTADVVNCKRQTANIKPLFYLCNKLK
jgi:hypothetical protein